MKIRHLSRPFEVKSLKADGTFAGYGSTFGDIDYGRDVIVAGAFTKSLAEKAASGRTVPMLWQHDMRNPIGVYPVIQEDAKGLYVEGEINMEVRQGQEAYSLMKQGALTGLSIGYSTLRDEFDEKQMIRRLLEVELYEVSPVTFPMNDNGRIQTVKAVCDLTNLSDFEKYLRDADFSQKEATAFISRFKQVVSTPSDSVDAKALKDALATLNSISLR